LCLILTEALWDHFSFQFHLGQVSGFLAGPEEEGGEEISRNSGMWRAAVAEWECASSQNGQDKPPEPGLTVSLREKMVLNQTMGP
jgi:hypothetical protein